MLSIDQIEIRTAMFKMKQAEVELLLLHQQMRPSHNLPINIHRENSRWVCIMETHPEIINCPIAYGNSPAQAMLNFDLMWNGAGIEIQPPDDEEEPL